MNKIMLTLHNEYVRSSQAKSKYERYNFFEDFQKKLKDFNLESEYPVFIGEYMRAYSQKSKEDITSFDKNYSDSKFLGRAHSCVSKILPIVSKKVNPKKIAVKDFIEFISKGYVQYEKTQDKLWKAPNGYAAPISIKSPELFLDLISKHAYSTSTFEDVFNIKEVKQADGTLKRGNQRTVENCTGFLPMSIFDIDDGLSIKDAKQLLENSGVSYSIVSTKSHGVKENDRFRIFIPLSFESLPKVFSEDGFKFATDNPGGKARRILEYKFIQIEIANALGILPHCDPSPLGDVARKFMPSPPQGAWNHVSHCEFNKPHFKLANILGAAKEAYEAYEEEQAKRRSERISRYGESKSLQQYAYDNSERRYIYDRDYIFMTDPLDVLYKYESDDGGFAKIINPSSQNPRVKVHGHEYSIWLPKSSDGFIIKDFVSGESTNLLGYMKHKFPNLDEFQRITKLKKDFPALFKKDLVYENPYYYLKELTASIRSCATNGGDWQAVKKDIQERKIANSIFCKDGKMSVNKLNGFRLEYSIEEAPKGVGIDKKSDIFKAYARGVYQLVNANKQEEYHPRQTFK
jgi:hypothetical protein